MIDRGVIHSVQIVALGSRLAADAALSATTLVVDDVSDFNERGGTILLNGTQYGYTSADFDADTITLVTGLTTAAVIADRVAAWPLTTEKQASVMTIGAEDAVIVRVPHALADRVPEGIRAPGDEESVQYSVDDGDFVITDVVGRPPVVDGSYIAPGTVPPGTVVVEHGADGTVARPVAAVVYWIGAATPANGLPYDFWYTATI